MMLQGLSIATKMWLVLILHVVCAAEARHYTQQWSVHISDGDAADQIAQKHGFINRGKLFDDVYIFEHPAITKRSLSPSHEHHALLTNEPQVIRAQQQRAKSRQKRDLRPTVQLNDFYWKEMWYLNRGKGLDMNVQPAWQDGITGKGVVVSILDDGIETDHPDLIRNYDPQASYDVNNHDDDPMPRYDILDSNRHGTRCAGEVAAVANNSMCSVGIAFGSSVGGVRMLDGDVTDAVEARSLSLNPQHIDIYSASWGPDDDGKTVDGPGELARRAFIEGVAKGRSGKGSIFVWASGNGGRDHDNCNCDGYTNSIWTLSISSATENGLVPWYSEACSSTLATTYSSGLANERQIMTTDLHHQCTTSHTGTSASAPLAAGICALALEANRMLTWRDMQHIVVRTARSENLHAPDWKTNAVGRNVSHSFGYGLMDAAAMVKLAKKWVTVPEQQRCEIIAKNAEKLIPAKSQVNIKLRVRECPGVNFLEHVQAKITLTTSRRGDLQIHLTSPGGTRSTLLDRRRLDVSRAGFNRWPFMTVHSWGETPVGIWQLEIHNEGRYLANLSAWELSLHGTYDLPDDGGQGHLLHDSLEEEPTEKEVKPLGNNLKNRETPSLNATSRPTNSSRLLVTAKPRPIEEEAQVGPARLSPNLTNSAEGCINSEANMCLECMDTYVAYQGQCLQECPMDTFISLSNKGKPNCRDCHYSCSQCKGPLSSHCLGCHPDARLRRDGTCLLIALDPVVNEARWYYWLMIAFVANVALIGVAAFIFIAAWWQSRHVKHEYEGLQPPRESIHTGVYLSSDED
ncbi:furin-like protease 1 isoform X2 [Neocloeon triangulifer]|uniref:furin-like protease 1 isoform X2 n=1 Tax=Neocloeon triangulifer TaxID=2078957 RepID=UPI00286EF9A3|nr:furin-like protease 1 isoform X2 [Neocloeon triangulifer]